MGEPMKENGFWVGWCMRCGKETKTLTGPHSPCLACEAQVPRGEVVRPMGRKALSRRTWRRAK